MSKLREEEAWDKVFEEGIACQDCAWCEKTRDPYGTGDSPTMRECTAPSALECFDWALED